MRLCGSEPWAGGGFIATATAAAAHTGENETPNTMCTNNTKQKHRRKNQQDHLRMNEATVFKQSS